MDTLGSYQVKIEHISVAYGFVKQSDATYSMNKSYNSKFNLHEGHRVA